MSSGVSKANPRGASRKQRRALHAALVVGDFPPATLAAESRDRRGEAETIAARLNGQYLAGDSPLTQDLSAVNA
jgi:hypothetical protein